MTVDWLASFEALKSVYIDEAFSNIAINEAVEQHKDCSNGFVRTFTKGVIRDTMRLDYIISSLADKGLKGIKKRTLIVLRMGIYAIDSLDSIKDYTAVNESVKLAKMVSRGTDGFVNALLRRYIRERAKEGAGESAVEGTEGSAGKGAVEGTKGGTRKGISTETCGLNIKYSFPDELCNLLKSQYGDETEKLLKALNTSPVLTIRVNSLKTTRQDLISILRNDGFDCEEAVDTNNAIIVKDGNLTASKYFKEGYFSIQGLSSIKAIEAFAPTPCSKVLDMCSAPGGKTTAMAEMMYDSGSITACDIYDHRLKLIQSSAKRLGISNITTRLLDGTKQDSSLAEAFDYVLCDVPCSGLGVIGSKPEIKYRVTLEEIEELKKIQVQILQNAFSYCKVGGRIMYSTCTINKDENDGIVDSFVKLNPFAKIIEKCAILPYNNTMGFYYCIMEKTQK
jgi:16S rRNA (cytosine967-C5)-methyltransferase